MPSSQKITAQVYKYGHGIDASVLHSYFYLVSAHSCGCVMSKLRIIGGRGN